MRHLFYSILMQKPNNIHMIVCLWTIGNHQKPQTYDNYEDFKHF